MKDIFVSYTKQNKVTADSIVNYLEQNGVSCYIAPRDINPGKPYASNIMHAINDCKAVLLVASAAINDSEHVLNEVEVIVSKKKPLLPIFIEDFELNDDYRYYLGRKQWIIAYPERTEHYYINILDALTEYLPKKAAAPVQKPIDDPDEPKTERTVFEYDSERGIMINPADHHRNISFRSDTLNNMMGGIFESVAKYAGEEAAAEIFFNTGYSSGKRFAEKINSQWDTGHSKDNIQRKIEQWCRFDSAVGWGRFEADIDFDDESGDLVGTLSINEAIMVDKTHKRKLCAFIRGYCTGVLETLLDDAETELTCRECPLTNRFKCRCVFDVRIRG